MTSEITPDPGNITSGASTTETSIWKSAAYGELEQVQRCTAEDPGSVNKADEQGFCPLQWAALNNRTEVVTCLIQAGAQVNAVDHTGQTALHWAAVRGSLPSAEALLRSGGDIKIKDSRGYTVAHVAAQYGQTALLYYLALRWETEIDSVDNDGRSCLHWAAYKGFADTIRLLLVLDARVDLPDKEGCTPLHWGAIRGNGEACTILIQGGSAGLLLSTDVTGCTPAELASEKGHRYLATYLKDYQLKEEKKYQLCGKAGALSFLTSTQLCPVIWLIIMGLVLLFVQKVVRNSALPELGVLPMFFSWVCIVTASCGLVLLYRVTIADPGFLPRSTASSSSARSQALASRSSPSRPTKPTMDKILGRPGKAKAAEAATKGSGQASDRLAEYRQLDSPALWAGNWAQLCVSCKIVRPLRAKHCSMTDRCVEEFDHFCPWVGNAIGKGNRFLFLSFLIVTTVAMISSLGVAILRIYQYSHEPKWKRVDGLPWMLSFIVGDSFMLLGVVALMATQASQISRNVTTNELANWPRYKYLRSRDGSFRNPFDKGCRENCWLVANPSSSPTAPAMFPETEPEREGLLPKRQPRHSCTNGCHNH